MAATDERSFFHHVRNYLSATTVVGILSYVGIAAFTRLMSVSEYGVYELFIGATGVLMVLYELNLRGAVARYFLERTEDFASFLRTTLFVVSLSAAAVSAVLYVLRGPATAFFFGGDSADFAATPVLLGLAAFYALAQVPWNLKWKLLVAQQKSKLYARLAMAKSALTLVAGVGAVLVFSHYEGMDWATPGDTHIGREYALISGITAVVLLFAFALARSLFKESRGGRVSWSHARYGLAFGVPLIAHSMSTQILTFFDRVVLNQVEDTHAVGLYTFAYNLGLAMGAVVTAMNQAWLPLFMDLRREEKYEQIQRLARKYSYMVAGIALTFVVFTRELGTILGDERYHEALPIVPVVVFAYVMVFIYTIYANHSFYLRRTWVISGATLIAGALNIVLNYWLIPDYGYAAAAWTTLASYVAMGLMHYGIARFVQRETIVPIRVFFVPLVGAAAASFGFIYVEGLIGNPWISFFALKVPFAALAFFLVRRQRRAKSDAKMNGDAKVNDER